MTTPIAGRLYARGIYSRQNDRIQDAFILSRSTGYYQGGVVAVGWTCQNRLGVDNGSGFRIRHAAYRGNIPTRKHTGKQRNVERD
jgi:hypothetical protein